MKKNNEKKQTGLFNKLKAFYQSRYGKMTIFFGFYFFFFLFLILNFDFNSNQSNTNNDNQQNNDQINNNDNSNSKPNNNQEKTKWEFNTLIENNYYYTYYVNEDNNILTFVGKINETNNLINEYNDNYFLNIYNINQIVKNSKYLDKVVLDSGYQYDYEITNNSLGEILNNDELSNELNKITIYTDNDFVITKIELDLSSYMKNINKFNEYKITLQYEKVK